MHSRRTSTVIQKIKMYFSQILRLFVFGAFDAMLPPSMPVLRRFALGSLVKQSAGALCFECVSLIVWS